MDKTPPNNRSHATRQFMSSLDELRTVLRSDVDVEAESQRPPSKVTPPASVDTGLHGEVDLEGLLREAAQDIERFMSEDSQDSH